MFSNCYKYYLPDHEVLLEKIAYFLRFADCSIVLLLENPTLALKPHCMYRLCTDSVNWNNQKVFTFKFQVQVFLAFIPQALVHF